MEQKNESPGAAMSARYRYFGLLVLFFSLSSLLVANDYATLWPGGEAWLLWKGLSGEAVFYFPTKLTALLARGDLWLFWSRLPGLLLLLLAAWLFYRWSQPVFGQAVSALALLAMAASPVLMTSFKQATADNWAAVAQLLLWISMLRTLKTPTAFWRTMSYVFGALSALVAPWATIIFTAVFMLLLFWRHPQGGRLFQGNLLLPVVLLLGLVNQFVVLGNGYVLPMNWSPTVASYGVFLGISLLGMLPLAGFVLAGFRDLYFKVAKDEELSLILVFAMLAAALAQSTLLYFLLALLAAKQMQLYFLAAYPWRDWVRGVAVLHVVLVCLLLFFLLVTGFIQLEGAGYRAVLGAGLPYWIFSFMGVVGLYAVRRDWAIGGTVLAGVAGMLFFWLQLYPSLEASRNWPARLLSTMSEVPRETVYLSAEEGFSLPAAAYFYRAGYDVQVKTDIENLSTTYKGGAEGFFLWPNDRWPEVNPYTPWQTQKAAFHLRGWYYDWRSGSWSVYQQ